MGFCCPLLVSYYNILTHGRIKKKKSSNCKLYLVLTKNFGHFKLNNFINFNFTIHFIQSE